MNVSATLRVCCCRQFCDSCDERTRLAPCPICQASPVLDEKGELAVLRRHADNDVPEAIFHLGNAYRNGDLYGFVKSGKKAAKLYKRGVELGDDEAMLALGGLYDDGNGVKKDPKKANQLYRMAADRGHPHAQHLSAIVCDDLTRSEQLRYVKLAADQGLTGAEYDLGKKYEENYDLEEAKRWYARAAAKGHEKADRGLARVSYKLRDNLSTTTPFAAPAAPAATSAATPAGPAFIGDAAVVEVLAGLGLADLLPLFREHEIDDSAFAALEPDYLRVMGIGPKEAAHIIARRDATPFTFDGAAAAPVPAAPAPATPFTFGATASPETAAAPPRRDARSETQRSLREARRTRLDPRVRGMY